eukprot:jgi/Phyca11/534810/estExt2_fgenesh1_pg.C_PHYCAscaffold_280053
MTTKIWLEELRVKLLQHFGIPSVSMQLERLSGKTSSLLCVPIKAQPSMSASSSTPFASSGRSGRRCSSSFSTSSSTDDDGDDRPVIGVFYAVNKMNANGETEGFDTEDEHVLRAICDELSALVERRAWELVFESPSYEDSESSDSETEGHVTRTFLSQYTTASPLVDLAVDMFELHELMDGFALPEATLRRFLHSVQAQYLDVPYHNTYHAFATLHMTFLMLSAQTPRERLAVFVAAFCHDMGHDARTNDFHVRCSSRLARRYNDHSVLENMHAAACFETMRRPGNDVLAGLEDGSSDTAGSRRVVRKRIIRAILATDMHRHASIVAKLHEAQVRGSRNDDETLRELLVDAVVHSADISGPTQSEEQHFRWTTRLLQEFNEQHAEEVELGISATAFMDTRPDSAEFARVNLAFVDSCAFPLWKALGGMLAGLEGCLSNVDKNRTMWATRLAEATKVEAEQKTGKPALESPERLNITKKLVSTPDTGKEKASSKFVTPTKAQKVENSIQPSDQGKSDERSKTYSAYATPTKATTDQKNSPSKTARATEPVNIPQQKAKRKLELR